MRFNRFNHLESLNDVLTLVQGLFDSIEYKHELMATSKDGDTQYKIMREIDDETDELRLVEEMLHLMGKELTFTPDDNAKHGYTGAIKDKRDNCPDNPCRKAGNFLCPNRRKHVLQNGKIPRAVFQNRENPVYAGKTWFCKTYAGECRIIRILKNGKNP